MGMSKNSVIIFHVARNPDGTIQPIVAAPINPTDTAMLQALLQTEHLGVYEVSHYDADFYCFVFDGDAVKPYNSVMIIKFIRTPKGDFYVDMQQEDLKAVTYAVNHYLSAEET